MGLIADSIQSSLSVHYLRRICLARKKHGIANHVNIDFPYVKARRLMDISNRLGIKATLFVRLHVLEYNPHSVENCQILQMIGNAGHKIGYHPETP